MKRVGLIKLLPQELRLVLNHQLLPITPSLSLLEKPFSSYIDHMTIKEQSKFRHATPYKSDNNPKSKKI